MAEEYARIGVRTFLRKEDGGFVPVESWNEPIPDQAYLEGSLELTINDVPLLTCGMWDDIDVLWSYLLDCLEELVFGGSASTYFPDQPVELAMERASSGMVRVSVRAGSGGVVKTTRTREEWFVHRVLLEGEGFFLKMHRLSSGNLGQRDREMKQIERIRSSVNRRGVPGGRVW